MTEAKDFSKKKIREQELKIRQLLATDRKMTRTQMVAELGYHAFSAEETYLLVALGNALGASFIAEGDSSTIASRIACEDGADGLVFFLERFTRF